jgi:2'-5' RNA ligase
MRLFLGIPMAPAVAAELASIVARLRSPSDALRWSAPESWHITLQFLGSTTPDQYACILPHLRALRHSPLSICMGGLGFFDRAGIFYAGVSTTPELLTLQQSITRATAHCGFIPETRPYQPHITLARAKAARDGFLALKSRLGPPPAFTRFTASEFLLYESFLAPSGSRYQVRERFPLLSS